MKKLFLTALLALGIAPAHAHEGHNKTPGATAAPHGGMMKGTDSLYLELVGVKNGVKIYPLDHDSKPLPVGDVKITGTFVIPRKTKSETVNFKAEADHFSAVIDAKGAYRYDLAVTVTHGGKSEKLKFTVEPK